MYLKEELEVVHWHNVDSNKICWYFKCNLYNLLEYSGSIMTSAICIWYNIYRLW
jgi:hypothetical protein